jgi:transcriptional regulator with XRE-family HTH domain
MSIKRLREEKGFTQAQLALLVGVGASAVQKWEYGESQRAFKVFVALCEVLECRPRDLLEDGEDLYIEERKDNGQN